MHRPFDRSILADFSQEVRTEIPAILDAVAQSIGTDGTPEHLQEAFRLMHTIKGASAVVGLATLSHLASELEGMLERAVAAGPPLAEDLAVLVTEATADFGEYVEACVADIPTHAIVARIVAALRRFDGLPPDGDATAVAALLEADQSEPTRVPESKVNPVEPPEQAASMSVDDMEIDVRPSAVDSSDLAVVFREEAHEHLQTIAGVMSRLRIAPDDREALQELRRSVHTLKGAAGMVGFIAVKELAHRVEDLLDRLYEGTPSMTADTQRTLFGAADSFDDLISGSGDEEALRSRVRGLYRSLDALLASSPEPFSAATVEIVADALEARSEEPVPPLDTPEPGEPIAQTALSPAVDDLAVAELRSARDRRTGLERRGPDRPRRNTAGQVVRVPFDRLDDVVKLVGELVINRSTFEQHFGGLIRQVDELAFSMARLRRVAAKLESQYEVRALATRSAGIQSPSQANEPRLATFSTHGFDELEFDRYTEFHLLSRELTETASDINTAGARLRDTITDFDSDLTRLGRLTGEVQDKVMQFRMLPLATLATRLERTVRVTAEDRGKHARLILEGDSIALDKTVLEEMADPLLHLLRNAVDHGIETPAARRAAGKPEGGRVVVRAYYEGTQVVIQIEDDGNGLDVERIRATAVTNGLVDAEEAPRLTDQEVYAFIFAPGFSTASEISQISGRGVGMDVVRARVDRLNGQISTRSTQGRGTVFTVRLPRTLAIMRVLLVRAGTQSFAVPMGAVLSIVKLGPTAVNRLGTESVINVEGLAHPLVVLAESLGFHAPDSEQDRPILIVSLGDRRIAVAVDEILESRDAVVKTLGGHLRRVHGFTGATLLGDGSVVLIVNPDDLARESAQAPVIRRVSPRSTDRDSYTIMVVDDSLSVRHVLSGLCKKAGWNVVQARDGVEALEVLHRTPRNPDVILLDIEMPRMDGYELTSTLRAQPAHQDIPIVMITSRAGDKHRQKAMALGATEYVVKPFQEDKLTELIDGLARKTRSEGAAA